MQGAAETGVGVLGIKNTFYHVEDQSNSIPKLTKSQSDSSLLTSTTSSSTTSSSLLRDPDGSPATGSKSGLPEHPLPASAASASSAGQKDQKFIIEALQGRIQDLERKKRDASEQENFREAQFYKEQIAKVNMQINQQDFAQGILEEQLKELEELKRDAKQREDFLEAQRLKEEIARLKKQVPREGAVSGYTALQDEYWSVGSELHELGECKPCAFFWSKKHPGGCDSGAACSWCHLCPEGALMQRRKELDAEQRRLNPQQAKGRGKSKDSRQAGHGYDGGKRGASSGLQASQKGMPFYASKNDRKGGKIMSL